MNELLHFLLLFCPFRDIHYDESFVGKLVNKQKGVYRKEGTSKLERDDIVAEIQRSAQDNHSRFLIKNGDSVSDVDARDEHVKKLLRYLLAWKIVFGVKESKASKVTKEMARYFDIVKKYDDEYLKAATQNKKSAILTMILNEVRDDGGYFQTKDGDTVVKTDDACVRKKLSDRFSKNKTSKSTSGSKPDSPISAGK